MSRTSRTVRLFALALLAAGAASGARAEAGLPVPTPPIRRPIPGPRLPAFPDLVVVASPSFAPVESGTRPSTARILVRNDGTGATGRGFAVRATVSLIASGMDLPYEIHRERSIGVSRDLAAGASIDLAVATFLPRRGDTVLIEGTVDASGQVAERNERNNSFSLRVVVR